MADILDKIVARKREEVDELLEKGNNEVVGPVDPPRGFIDHLLMADGIAVIAEAKKASPSKGVICEKFDPVEIARDYQAGGASALSVLTDVDFFQGSLEYIPAVRKAVKLPVIRKDFIIHESQINEARLYGADAILLIAAILEKSQIRDYLQMAGEFGMDCLVEVHDEQEAEICVDVGSKLIGVNNRNLRDFTVDIFTTIRIRNMIPEDIPVVGESGIRNNDDVRLMADNGVAAVLVGESLMRAADRAQALKVLIGKT